ncbi:MAG: hypothetical protein ABSD02_21100 [Steroidobacteraceae bacterium]
MGNMWQQALTPTGTVTIGDPVTNWDDVIEYDDFDVCEMDDWY